jgi:exopolysaccharide biosynthesis protein
MLDLKCIEAVNFDGGGSSSLIVDNKIMNNPSDGSLRRIGSALFTISNP